MPRSNSSEPAGEGVGAPPAPQRPVGDSVYATSLALLTDLYEITMAYGFFRNGLMDREAVFCLSFRESPFDGGYAIACGLEPAVEYLSRLRFTPDDIAYLAEQRAPNGDHLFSGDFLDYLRDFRFTCDVDMVPEGTVVFPHEPLLRIRGPILQAQLVESALLNIVNFQTLIATRAARVVSAAGDDPVLEFGMRRAQGIDGALAASRAAFVGGCSATSNVLAGKLYGIPVAGTHAHSWVMSFDDEMTAFEAFADAMPSNSVLLVDTYDTLRGVERAIEVGRRLRARGHDLNGIRLDSGDLAYLSIEARRMLDEAGFEQTTIYASNDLDEHLIESLKLQGARIGSWGVGTRLVTASEQPALGGVYKLTAIREENGSWDPRIKVSEQVAKTTIPGVLQLRRFEDQDGFVGDMIYDESTGPAGTLMVDPLDPTRRKSFPAGTAGEDLLVPVMRGGELVYELPALSEVRQRVRDQLSRLHPGIRRFVNPHQYPVGLEEGLHRRRTELILQLRDAPGTFPAPL